MDSIIRAFIPSPDHQNEINVGQNRQRAGQAAGSGSGSNAGRGRDDFRPEDDKDLQQLRNTLQNNIQASRMQHHAYEPLSLPGSQPVSRVRATGLLCLRVRLFADRCL